MLTTSPRAYDDAALPTEPPSNALMYTTRHNDQLSLLIIEFDEHFSFEQLSEAFTQTQDPANRDHAVVWDFRHISFERVALNAPEGIVDSLLTRRPKSKPNKRAFLVRSARDEDLIKRHLDKYSLPWPWIATQYFADALAWLEGR